MREDGQYSMFFDVRKDYRDVLLSDNNSDKPGMNDSSNKKLREELDIALVHLWLWTPEMITTSVVLLTGWLCDFLMYHDPNNVHFNRTKAYHSRYFYPEGQMARCLLIIFSINMLGMHVLPSGSLAFRIKLTRGIWGETNCISFQVFIWSVRK